MRIRKNAKLSSILFSHASTPEPLQTHVCQLNQSPWDVIPFTQESYPSFNTQFEGEDSFTGNGSFGDSIGAVESSVASMMDAEEKPRTFKEDDIVTDDNETEKQDKGLQSNEEMKVDDEFGFKKDYKTMYRIKTDGKSWHYKTEPKDGHTLSDHNLSLFKSYGNSSTPALSHPIKKPDKALAVTTGGRRGRARAAKKGSSSSNPYEFYYYSGFGPLWGKRRGDRVSEGKKFELKDVELENMIQNEKTPSSSSQIDNDEFDFVDDEDDEDEDDENGDSGKKRMRKPVKARSLKSLM